MAAKEKVAILDTDGAPSVGLRFLVLIIPSKSSEISPISKWLPGREVKGKSTKSRLFCLELVGALGMEERTKVTFLASVAVGGVGEGGGTLPSWVPKVA